MRLRLKSFNSSPFKYAEGVALDFETVEMPSKSCVIDLETTVTPDTHSPKATDGAKPVLIAVIEEGYAVPCLYGPDGMCALIADRPKMYIGHNIKFDLAHLDRSDFRLSSVSKSKPAEMECYKITDDLRDKKAVVWDTQFATYLASGHSLKFPSLEESLEFWDVPTSGKSLDLKEELPKYDWDITKIPKLAEYAANDVILTAKLAAAQFKHPWVMENISWLLAMMQGLLATHEIEQNGLLVDGPTLFAMNAETEKRLTDADTLLKDFLKGAYVDARIAENFNPDSPKLVETVLYGGSIVSVVREHVGVYATGKKMGEPRYKINKTEIPVMGLVPSHVSFGFSGTDDHTLKTITKELPATAASRFCELMMDHRTWQKIHGTYVDGMKKHLRIVNGNYYIYPQINLCLTSTGRTSSSDPNIQNFPTTDEANFRSIFVSRYTNGSLIEVDFKQIEIIALALWSGDPQLIADIKAGRDIHTETGKMVFGHTMSKEERRIVKTINFGLIYGGGERSLSEQAGVSVVTTAKIIDAFYTRYSALRRHFKLFRDSVTKLIETSGTPTGQYIGTPPTMQKQALYESMTGRRYAFAQVQGTFDKAPMASYTQTRNYPIQGFATGDLMLAAMGLVYTEILRHNRDIKLVGLIHDSLIFDCPFGHAPELIESLGALLSKSGKYLQHVCKDKFEFDLPLKVEFSMGPNLGAMKSVP